MLADDGFAGANVAARLGRSRTFGVRRAVTAILEDENLDSGTTVTRGDLAEWSTAVP
jgi:hypothetical protein